MPQTPPVSGPSAESRGLHPPSRETEGTGGHREASDPEQGVPAALKLTLEV